MADFPVGVPLTNGRPNLLLIDNPQFSKLFVIPRHDYPEWELATDVDVSRFEKVDIHSLDNVMHFGKYMAREVRDVINMDRKYLLWLINNIHVFALSEDAVSYLEQNFPDFDKLAIELNKQKIVWLQSGKTADHLPEAWKSGQSIENPFDVQQERPMFVKLRYSRPDNTPDDDLPF